MERYLSHHGVKGQQWGVRNGPPYPIEDKVLRKGTKLNSVSIDSNSEKYRKRGRLLYTYRPENEWDNKVYKGPFSVYLTQYKGFGILPVNEHKFEVVEDLKMPTSKERIDEFINVYNKKKVSTIRELKSVQDRFKQYNVSSSLKDAMDVDVRRLETSEQFKSAYKLFNLAMENSHYYKSTKEYIKVMKKKYDAMVDDNNQGVYNRAQDPIIIFRPDKVLRVIEQSRAVPISEVRKNYEEVRDELEKYGERVAL